MTNTIRETKRYQYFESTSMGCTAIYDKHTGSQSNWNTGTDADDEREHLDKLDDAGFDEYCEMMTSKD